MQLQTQPSATMGRGWRRLFAVGGALAIVAAGVLGTTTSAQAVEVTPTLSDARVTLGYDPQGTGTQVAPDTAITTDTQLTFHANWELPGRVNAGDTFEVPLPTTFRIASSEPFQLRQDDGTAIAQCQYTTPDEVIVCTILGGPHADVRGNIWFTGRLAQPTDPSETPSWEVGGDPVILPKPKPSTPGSYTPPFGTTKWSTGADIVGGKAELRWALFMWPGCEGSGATGGTCVDEFEVSDELITTDAAMPHTLLPQSFVVERWERAQNPDGSWAVGSGVDTGVPGSRVNLAGYVNGVWTINFAELQGESVGEPQVSADNKSFTFNLSGAKIPYQYRVRYTSVADGAVSLDGDVFQNRAAINGEPFSAEGQPRVMGGGGADAGAYTSFAISKAVTNDTQQQLPTQYTLTITQGAATETVSVPADGTLVNSPYFPVSGGTIVVCEQLPAVPGVAWAPYTITGTGVTGPDADGCYTVEPVGGVRLAIEVANHALLATVSVGDFTWIDANRNGIQDEGESPLPGVELTLEGPDGQQVTDVNGQLVVPQITNSEGKYLFENLPTLESGSYTVRVTKVPGGYLPTPQIEAGDDRAVDSSKGQASSHLPLDVDGAADLTLDFGFVLEEATVTPPTQPTPDEGLAFTGNDSSPLWPLGGAALLVGGITLLTVRRRLATQHS